MLSMRCIIIGAMKAKNAQTVLIGHFRSAIKLVSLDRL
ncbi:hypothetical protein SX4_1371 [Vibrio mimicus SX-4]|nr:hypothetical protein SX4_1371 [Vibrio mimicus SX-4]